MLKATMVNEKKTAPMVDGDLFHISQSSVLKIMERVSILLAEQSSRFYYVDQNSTEIMRTVEGKVIVLGSQGVGKTSMIMHYIGKMSNHRVSPTIGAGFFNCKMDLEDVRFKFQIWDTAGQERFRSMAPMYYRNTNVALLVFDLTQYNTFMAIKTWVTELQRNVEETITLVMVGNKSDLIDQREVSYEESKKYATKIGAIYYEISALHDDGIEHVFQAAATGLLKLNSENYKQTSNLKICESINTGVNGFDIPLSPSSEESFSNTSIAYGIHTRPPVCC